MECKVTCFQRTMHTVKSIASNKQHILAEACDIVQNYTFQDLLNFGVEVGCFDQISAYTLYDGIVMWEDLEGNYFEEDYDKLHMLYEKMGITESVFNKYLEEQETKKLKNKKEGK